MSSPKNLWTLTHETARQPHQHADLCRVDQDLGLYVGRSPFFRLVTSASYYHGQWTWFKFKGGSHY
jgi:hypothetical protein